MFWKGIDKNADLRLRIKLAANDGLNSQDDVIGAKSVKFSACIIDKENNETINQIIVEKWGMNGYRMCCCYCEIIHCGIYPDMC